MTALAISKSWLNEMPIPRFFAGTEPIENLCKQLRWDVVPIYFYIRFEPSITAEIMLWDYIVHAHWHVGVV